MLGNGNNYLGIDYRILKEVGVNATVMLSQLIEKHRYEQRQGTLENDEFSFLREELEEVTTLGKDAQRAAMDLLKQRGILTVKRKGIPCRNVYAIDFEKLAAILEDAEPHRWFPND